MTITAKVIEDSISEDGKGITTLQLCYPRFIHAEFMTHRVFSRNASSSRAIPVAKVIEQVRTNPAMPIHWGKNQPGMQASGQLTGVELDLAKREWLQLADRAAYTAECMVELGLHKQVANRILEPFQHISVIVTATDWKNFFALRDHPDAQPEIRELAIQMAAAMYQSTPTVRKRDRFDAFSWHLPYITDNERGTYVPEYLAKISGARCARVSYLTHEGKVPDRTKDLDLYTKLVGSVPLHASPIEHQAYPLPLPSQRSNNFVGWRQYRQLVEQTFQ